MRDNIGYEVSRFTHDELDMPRSSAGTWALVASVACFWIFLALLIRWWVLA